MLCVLKYSLLECVCAHISPLVPPSCRLSRPICSRRASFGNSLSDLRGCEARGRGHRCGAHRERSPCRCRRHPQQRRLRRWLAQKGNAARGSSSCTVRSLSLPAALTHSFPPSSKIHHRASVCILLHCPFPELACFPHSLRFASVHALSASLLSVVALSFLPRQKKIITPLLGTRKSLCCLLLHTRLFRPTRGTSKSPSRATRSTSRSRSPRSGETKTSSPRLRRSCEVKGAGKRNTHTHTSNRPSKQEAPVRVRCLKTYK